jgi:hypothetical protein
VPSGPGSLLSDDAFKAAHSVDGEHTRDVERIALRRRTSAAAGVSKE